MTPYRPLIYPLFFRIQNIGMYGMCGGVKANEKHYGGNEKILGSSSDPLLTPYRPLRGLKFYFWILASGVCTVGLRLSKDYKDC